ncbi:MAG: polyphosphate kinase [Actinoplanes sp.]|nr:polyphosphate kinase [Actinoplanes sp.]
MQAEAADQNHHNSAYHGPFEDDQTTPPYTGPVEALGGYRVADDDDDDPILLNADGSPVDTWREDYPYDQRMPRSEYDHDKRLLQIELLKLQNWCKTTGERLVVFFEGRDAAGKGGTIKRFMEHLNPRGASVVALEKPNERENTQWYFQRYLNHLPAAGEIVLFDRSWYNRAGVERVMGFCTRQEYLEFMRQAPDLERMLVRSGIHLVKFWFSVSQGEQRTRFAIRQVDPVRQWKLSPMDLQSLDKWGDYTEAKEAMFFYTDTADAPLDRGQEQRQEARPAGGDPARAQPLRLRGEGPRGGRHARPAADRPGFAGRRGHRDVAPGLPAVVARIPPR